MGRGAGCPLIYEDAMKVELNMFPSAQIFLFRFSTGISTIGCLEIARKKFLEKQVRTTRDGQGPLSSTVLLYRVSVHLYMWINCH